MAFSDNDRTNGEFLCNGAKGIHGRAQDKINPINLSYPCTQCIPCAP